MLSTTPLHRTVRNDSCKERQTVCMEQWAVFMEQNGLKHVRGVIACFRVCIMLVCYDLCFRVCIMLIVTILYLLCCQSLFWSSIWICLNVHTMKMICFQLNNYVERIDDRLIFYPSECTRLTKRMSDNTKQMWLNEWNW